MDNDTPHRPTSPTSTRSTASTSTLTPHSHPQEYHIAFTESTLDLDFTPIPNLQLHNKSDRRNNRTSRRLSALSTNTTSSFRPVPRRLSALPPSKAPKPGKGHGRDFWLVFVAVCSSTFLEALDFTTVSTALPTIVNDLQGADKFTWIGAAYTLSSTAFQPLSGALADIFGRRPCMLGSLILFAIGSAICGAAQNMPMLIAGRTVQGVGAAGIGSLTDIIVADLVPLKDRGTYMGILSSIWAIASAIGPSIGGVFAQKLSWRWLFYINIPLTAFSFIMVWFFLKLRTPADDILHKLSRVDWLGNLIVISGATSVVIALTWGGVTYPWSAPQVLVPLILGVLAIIFFLYYEKRWAAEPSVPFELLSNSTSLSGYLGTFFHGILSTAIVYYLPVYFQAVKVHTPVQTGIAMLELSLTIAPVAIITGVTVAIFNRYRPQNYFGWVLSIVGFALLSLVDEATRGARLAGLQLVAAVGVGVLYAAVTFPILAPLGVQENAHALAFFMFVRTFSYTFGIAIGSTVLQNELQHRLPPAFLARFPPRQDIAYSAVDVIRTLPLRSGTNVTTTPGDGDDFVSGWGKRGSGSILKPRTHINLLAETVSFLATRHQSHPSLTSRAVLPPLPGPTVTREEVTHAFGESMRVIWRVLAGIAGMGLISCIGMKEIVMSEELDEGWGMESKGQSGGVARSKGDVEGGKGSLGKGIEMVRVGPKEQGVESESDRDEVIVMRSPRSVHGPRISVSMGGMQL